MFISKKKYDSTMNWVYQKGISEGYKVGYQYGKTDHNNMQLLGIESVSKVIQEAEEILRNE